MKASILILLVTAISHAETAPFFITESGSKIEPVQAIEKSVKGEQVYKCQPVEAKVSKSGTSIGLKNVKKQKTQVN